MPEEGEENEKVRGSESEKVAEPLPANKKRILSGTPYALEEQSLGTL